MLDNIPHVKAFWIATGVEIAQLALWFGADDLDGTVQEEKIYHMAGARTPEVMTTAAIRRLIRNAGREPVERDTLYNVVTGPEIPDEVSAGTVDAVSRHRRRAVAFKTCRVRGSLEPPRRAAARVV